MNFQEWFALLYNQILATSFLEWVVVIFGVAEVLLAKRNNVLLYPTGLVAIILGIYLLLNAQLYAEVLLSMYYFGMSIYGWIVWKDRRENSGQVIVSWTTKNEMATAVSIAVIGYFVLYFVLINYTNSNVPVCDAFVSSTAWAGMWLLTRRKIENWIFLNISNIVAIPLKFHKDLPLMALLTTFLFIVAIFGFFDWRKIYRQQQALQLI